MPTTPPSITTIPEFPALGDTSFNAKAYAWATHERTTLSPELAALATNVFNNSTEAAASASAASASAAGAATSAVLAGQAANVTQWVSGTTYQAGQVVWSPSSFLSYRRRTTGAGTVDPASDTTNWTLLGGSSGAGMTLIDSVVPSNGVGAIVRTGIPAYKSLVAMVAEPVGKTSQPGGLFLQLSTDNGSSFSSDANLWSTNSAGVTSVDYGFAQVFGADLSVLGRCILSAGSVSNDSTVRAGRGNTSSASPINAIRIGFGSATFTGTGRINLYGIN